MVGTLPVAPVQLPIFQSRTYIRFNQLDSSLTADNAQVFRFAYDSITQKYGYKVKEADTDVFVPFKSGGAVLTKPISTVSFNETTWADHPIYYDIGNDCHVDYCVRDDAGTYKGGHYIAVAINDEIMDSCNGTSTLEGTLSLKAGDVFKIKAYSTASSRCITGGTLKFY